MVSTATVLFGGAFFQTKGVNMKAYPATRTLVFASLALISLFVSCSPKCVVRGRVVDAETGRPIEGAAVAIRWYAEYPDQQSDKSETVDAVQALSDDLGVFKIPEYPDKQHVLGVYKSGYICWSSRDVFLIGPGESNKLKNREPNGHYIRDGMKVALSPLKNHHSRDLHAGFTVMVAGESTDTDAGPFHQAIRSEYQLWRENMRKDFQKQVGAK